MTEFVIPYIVYGVHVFQVSIDPNVNRDLLVDLVVPGYKEGIE